MYNNFRFIFVSVIQIISTAYDYRRLKLNANHHVALHYEFVTFGSVFESVNVAYDYACYCYWTLFNQYRSSEYLILHQVEYDVFYCHEYRILKPFFFLSLSIIFEVFILSFYDQLYITKMVEEAGNNQWPCRHHKNTSNYPNNRIQTYLCLR